MRSTELTFRGAVKWGELPPTRDVQPVKFVVLENRLLLDRPCTQDGHQLVDDNFSARRVEPQQEPNETAQKTAQLFRPPPPTCQHGTITGNPAPHDANVTFRVSFSPVAARRPVLRLYALDSKQQASGESAP